MTALSSDSAAGAEVANAGGSAYARQDVTFATAAAGTTSNTNALAWTNMPSCTVVGLEIWNSTGTVRLWYGPLTPPRRSTWATRSRWRSVTST
uniref:phage tail fiber protein n=1 Tax=Planotetraspora phitsanulokensis TaxID=575192 RepID=UPI001950AD97|nr:hypothetical protein [Planotetraspora phitsanulokensis]